MFETSRIEFPIREIFSSAAQCPDWDRKGALDSFTKAILIYCQDSLSWWLMVVLYHMMMVFIKMMISNSYY